MLIVKQYKKNNFTGILNRAEGATTFFVIEEAKKKTVLDIWKRTVKVLWFRFVVIQY